MWEQEVDLLTNAAMVQGGSTGTIEKASALESSSPDPLVGPAWRPLRQGSADTGREVVWLGDESREKGARVG